MQLVAKQLERLRTARDRRLMMELREQVFKSRAAELTTNLRDGRISPADWQRLMKEEVKGLQVGQAIIGKGGEPRQMTQADWGRVGYRCKTQYRFLQGFASDIRTEVESGKGVGPRDLARAEMYGGAGRASYWDNATELEDVERFRWVLNPLAEHCDDCVQMSGYSSLTWEDIPGPPGSGWTRCRTNCACRLEPVRPARARLPKERPSDEALRRIARETLRQYGE